MATTKKNANSSGSKGGAKRASAKAAPDKKTASASKAKAAPAGTAKAAAKASARGSGAAKSAVASKKPAAARTGAARKPAPKKSADEMYGESNSLPFQINDLRDEGKRKKIILIAAASLLALLLLFFGIRGMARAISSSGSKGNSARQNTLALAQKYLDKGQYDKAMDLLNGLLIANPDDAEADALLDSAIQLKKASDEQAAAQNNIVVQPADSSYNINIDTDELTAALREQNEKSQQMINDLLEQQRQSQDAQRAEAAAEKKAAEELKKKEEAERKAKEADLAQKNAALKSKIGDINERILAGRADLNTGDIDSAFNNFRFAVSQLPLSEGEPEFSAAKYSEVASALYDAYAAEKDPVKKDKLKKAALDYVNKSLSVNPNDSVSHYILGMNFAESSPPDWVKAERELLAAVQNDDDNYMYYYQLGRAQFRLRKFEAARDSFQKSIKYNRNFDLAHYNLGMTFKRLKLNKDALGAFRNAHTVNQQNSKAWLEEARILNEAYHDQKGAIDCYNKVISLDPVNSSALNECGVVYSSLGQYAKAEECHRKAVALLRPGDKDPITCYNLATALYNQGKHAEAQKYAKLSYEQKGAISGAKERAAIVYNYALVEDTLGNTDKAIELYKEVLALDPSNSKTKTNLGVMFMAMGDADAALTFFLDAYKVEKSFELENDLGSAYLAKKDYANAVTHFQNALKKSPKDQTVRFNLAQAYAGSGDFDNAKTTYLEILNADPKNYDSYIELSKVFIALKDTASAESYLKILQQKNPTYRKAEVDKLLAATAN